MKLPSPTPRPFLRGSSVDADFDLAVLGAALWRHRMKILRPTLIVALVTFAVVLFIPPKYLSETRVLVVGRDNIYLRPDADRDPADHGNVDAEAVTSQAQLILSRDLAIEVINKLKLGERPEFDPGRGRFSLIRSLLGIVGVVRNPGAMTPEERALDAYYRRLNVYPVEKSRVIVIDFLSEDPQLAARVANAIADAYLERQRLAKQEQAASAGRWLAGEIESMRKKVAEAEAKIEEFRAKSNLLVGPNGTTLAAQQLGDLNAQLAAARAQKAAAAAKAKIIREMLKSGDPIESSDILNSELIRRLSEQRVTLRAQLAEQSSSLLDNHPRIKELRAQIDDLDKQIRHEAETMARSLENDARLADARVESELAILEQFKNQAASINAQDVELRALERDAKSQRDLLESYLAKYREATARDTIASAPPDARIISRALVSNVPAYPKKLPTVLIATLAALVLSSGLVVTREFLSNPVVGATGPTARGGGLDDFRAVGSASPAPPSTAVTQEQQKEALGQQSSGVPVSALEELAHHLHRAGGAGGPIAFFSVAPQLETSGIAIKFARALAQESRVVLVGLGTAGAGDTAISQISGDPSAPGLAELAAGTASFGEIITRDKASRLHLIVSGRDRADRRSLLTMPIVARNFAALAMTYDHVVIDVGAIGGAELAAIAALAPHAMLVAETFVGLATDKARERLEDAGFDRVTILVAGRSSAEASASPTAAGNFAGAAAAAAVA
jgi:succinoglycan biosynthesis transport protein ExoP